MNFWDNYYRVKEDGVFNIKTGMKLKPSPNSNGYLQFGLYINGKSKRVYLHRILAITFKPNPDNKLQVDHIDRNKLNNDLSNLRWVTHLENNQNKERGFSNELNISIRKCGNYQIAFNRNKLKYTKGLPKTYTMQQIIIQRDLMLSMF